MKKCFTVLILLSMLASVLPLRAQVVTLGDESVSSNSITFYPLYENSWWESTYSAAEIGMSGTISAVLIPNNAEETIMCDNVDIYMGHRVDSVYDNIDSWTAAADLTLVYSGTNIILGANEYEVFPLTTPFSYNGTDNLVIVYAKRGDDWSSSLEYYYTTMANNRSLYRYADGSSAHGLHPGTATGNLTVDRPDVQLVFGAFCAPPTDLVVGNITTDGAVVSWSGNADSYFYQYKTALESWEDVSTFTASGTSVTLTSLSPSAHYQMRVMSNCNGVTSGWTHVAFTTLCVPQTTLPYIEDFEGYESHSEPDCWTLVATNDYYGVIYPHVESSSLAHNGSGYMYFYPASSSPNMAALPALTESINNLRLTFWMKAPGTSSYMGTMEVGVMTDLSDTSTFTPLSAWNAGEVGSADWIKYTVDFNEVTPSNSDYIVFRCSIASFSYDWFVDDVTVDYIPACDAPTQLACLNASPNAVTLTWDGQEGDAYILHYRTVNDSAFQVVNGVSLDSEGEYVLMNLNPATNYVWYVSSVCPDGSLASSDPAMFATTMIPEVLPYSTDFSENADRNWLLNNGTCSNYWVMAALPNSNQSALFVTNDGTTPGYDITAVSVVSAQKLFTIGTLDQVKISFDVKLGGESTFDYMKLFLAPPTETYPAYTSIPSTYYGLASFSEYAFNFSGYSQYTTNTGYASFPYIYNLTDSNTVHIDAVMPNPNTNPNENSLANVVLAWKNDGGFGNQPAIIISNFSVTSMDCSMPMNLTVTNLAAESATISWNESNANSWTVEYGVHGFTPGDGTATTVNVNTNTVGITGLVATTTYDVYVTAICDNNLESPAALVSFITPCASITALPQTWDFESANSTSPNPLPECWSRTSSSSYSQYPYCYTHIYEFAHSGDYSLLFGNENPSIGVLPGIDASVLNIQNLQLSLYAKCSSSATTLEVGVMTNPYDATTFTLVQSLSMTSAYELDPYIVSFADYEGNGTFIAIRNHVSGVDLNYVYVDDVTLEYAPDCSKAYQLSAEVTYNEADLSWTAIGDDFDLYYKSESDANYTVVEGVSLNDNGVYQLDQLNPSTTYYWYVVTNCDDTAYTSNTAVFTTKCAPFTAPFLENFNAAAMLPSCWETFSGSAADAFNGTNPIPYSFGWRFNSTAVFGTNHAALNIYGTVKRWLVSPTINLAGLTHPILTFNLALTDYGNGNPVVNSDDQVDDKFMVIISTDDGVTWSAANATVWDNTGDGEYFFNLIPAAGQEVSISLDDYVGQSVRVAFYGESTINNGDNDLHIDNVSIVESSSCATPSQIVVTNLAPSSAEIEWTENGSATEWVVEYGVMGFTLGAGTTITVTGTPEATLTNLMDNTSYTVYVKALCGDGSYSLSTTANFKTPCGSVVAPYVEDFSGFMLPDCWKRYIGLFTDGVTSSNLVETLAGWTFGSQNVFGYYHPRLNIYGENTQNWIVTPNIDLSALTTPVLSFKLAFTAYNSTDSIDAPHGLPDDKFMVIISTDNGNTWNSANATVWNNTNNGDYSLNNIPPTGEVVYVPLNQYMGQTICIAFYGESTVDNGDNDLHIDSIAVGNGPMCMPPTNLIVSDITASSAVVSWRRAGAESAWVVEYKEASASTWTTINVSDTTVTLSNLTSSTAYNVRVMSDCGSQEGTSMYTTTSFTTDAEPVLTEPTATTAAATNVGQTSATLNGSISNPDNVAITAQGFEWKATNGGTYVAVSAAGATMTYNLTGLTASTGYTYRAYVTTANGTHYGEELTFTTEEAQVEPCETPTGLATSDITSESITLTWNAAGNVESWSVLYRPVNGQNTVMTSNTNTYTITGLTPATTYEIQVRANCGGDEVSPWTAIATVTTLVGLNSYLENSVTLYPNPAKEFVDVRVDGDINVTGMEVYDVYGKLIRTVVGANNDSSTRINVSDLSSGMYFVRVTTEQGVVTKRFVRN